MYCNAWVTLTHVAVLGRTVYNFIIFAILAIECHHDIEFIYLGKVQNGHTHTIYNGRVINILNAKWALLVLKPSSYSTSVADECDASGAYSYKSCAASLFAVRDACRSTFDCKVVAAVVHTLVQTAFAKLDTFTFK